jgi:hypothetical protein
MYYLRVQKGGAGTNEDSNGVNIGLITGAIGGLLRLILLPVGFAFFMKRYRSQTSEYGQLRDEIRAALYLLQLPQLPRLRFGNHH